MSVRTVSLNDVTVSDKPTHIVIYQGSDVNDNNISELKQQVFNLTQQVEAMSKKLLHFELGINQPTVKPSPFFSANVAPEPEGLEVHRLSEIPRVVQTSNSSVVFQAVVSKLPSELKPAPVHEMEEVDVSELEEDEEVEEEAEEVEEAEEEEEEAEALELEEFEYKGVTYFKDSENQVYEKDDDGDLNDTPIGVWNEEKKKLLKYKS